MKKLQGTYLVAAVLLFTLAFTGCRSSRQAGSSAAFTKRQRTELLTPLAQYPVDVQYMSAKTTIALNYNGLSATVKGKLRMRRDEVVQMSITALGLMEIASIEFTPKAAYIIDRVNRRYAVLDYSSGLLQSIGANFGTVQALFWNRLFIPGEEEVWNKTEDFTITDAGTQCVVEPSRQRMLKCKFYTDADFGQLQQTNLNLQHYAATWRYGQFETIGNYTYPAMHDVSVSGSSRAVGTRIGLTDISTLDTGSQNTTNLSNYKQVDLEQLLSILNMLR